MKILNNKDRENLLKQRGKTIVESFQKEFDKIKRIDEDLRSEESRKLTQDEVELLYKSAQLYKRKHPEFDFKQDSSFRYISNYGKGHEYWGTINLDTLHQVQVPVDAHIANIVGNMNYTDAYKKQEISNNQNHGM